GAKPEEARAVALADRERIEEAVAGSHMVFITAGMGGGTGTGAAPIIAKIARELGILTVGVITKPFHFEGQRRMRTADSGIGELHKVVDTLLIIPNQNLFRVANEKTTFADAFAMADQVLYSGVACITDLMVKEGLINLDFADVRAVMREMGKAMMGTGEASGEKRALTAAEAAISNPLIDDASMKGARGLLISITGGKDLTLYEVDEAATRIREEVDQDANIIVGATFDESLDGIIRVSVVATGIDNTGRMRDQGPAEVALKELAGKVRNDQRRVPAQPQVQHAPAAYAAQPPIPNPAIVSAAASVESAAHAAVAAAILPQTAIDEVSIRPKPMKPSLFDQPEPEAPPAIEPPAPTFVPPAPERVMRTPRMPRIDELPLPARAMMDQRGQQAENHPEERRKSLMQRLASVGLGRRSEEPEAPPAPRTARAMPQYEQPQRPTARQPEGRAEPVSEYARRPAPQGLDPHGRQTAVHNSPEDDQLDIPAFLRRQAN
ncbi:MAG TPA: cell division protein FtsZ, partial [Pseudolabrys sp.]|nr:cell division protein FtsZ [Pseudolabrys sp.]